MNGNTEILMDAPGAVVEVDANRIAHIVHVVAGCTMDEAGHAANLIVDYLIVTFHHAGEVRLQ